MTLMCRVYVIAAILATALPVEGGGAKGSACTEDNECTNLICVGKAGHKVCAEDPCTGVKPCGDHGTCSPNKTATTPLKICKCIDGYGGAICDEKPECTTDKNCTDAAKPTCTKVAGEKSVCAKIASACVEGDCKNGGKCTAGGKLPCTCKEGYSGAKCDNAGNFVAAAPGLVLSLLVAVIYL